jgi:NAD(P)-dependent dehydrogenase (short-subunit alcohol dehydrogenase family)
LTAEFALNALCRSVAKEYGRREITCNVVVVQDSDEEPNGLAAVAETVLFFASEEAAFVNGEVIRVAMNELHKENLSFPGGGDYVRR